jgi:hypothetical protein
MPDEVQNDKPHGWSSPQQWPTPSITVWPEGSQPGYVHGHFSVFLAIPWTKDTVVTREMFDRHVRDNLDILKRQIWTGLGYSIALFRRVCPDAEWRMHRRFLISNWQIVGIQTEYTYY